MSLDFEAAVQTPFRMQPGLRRLADAALHLTPLASGAAHQRAKLDVLQAHAGQALCRSAAFDPAPALDALCRHAAAEHPSAWRWDGHTAHAPALDVAVGGHRVHAGPAAASDVVACLSGLPGEWRRPGLLCLAFAEDFAILDATDTCIPWLAVTLPSHWAPQDKVGRPFAEVHAPVADNALLVQAAQALSLLVSGTQRWERFVWTIAPHGRLDAHPRRLPPNGWHGVDVAGAWWRSERQTFIPVPGRRQAVFTIRVDVQPLADAVAAPGRAARLHGALASMSDAVVDYRGLTPVRAALLAWLAARP